MTQVLALTLLWLTLLFPLGEGGKIKRLGAFTDQSASESLRKALEPEGDRVTQEDEKILCEIWLRKGVPTQGKTDTPDVIYTELAQSTLIGVISFPQGGADYRGQPIKPGAYTLRYALMPSDGNHLGAAPSRDFLLLIPLAADQDVDARFEFTDLANLSKKASGTNHPAPLSLVPPERQEKLPAVVKNDAGHMVFVTNLQLKSGGTRSFALVVKGQAEQ